MMPYRVARHFRRFPGLLLVCWAMTNFSAHAADEWSEALAHMPLPDPVRQLNRTNCVEVMLRAFQSNQAVKALVFLPGATDEFYMFRRAKADLTNPSPTLLDAVCALTNQTLIRATFQRALLLLHTDEDPLTPDIQVDDSSTRERVQTARVPGHLLFMDRDWDVVQPILRRSLRVDIRPWRHSTDSWHFYRHSFAGWELSGREALECAALGGKSRFVIRHNQIVFQPDARVHASVRFESKLPGH